MHSYNISSLLTCHKLESIPLEYPLNIASSNFEMLQINNFAIADLLDKLKMNNVYPTKIEKVEVYCTQFGAKLLNR